MKDKNSNIGNTLAGVILNRSFAFLHNLEKFVDDPVEENIHQSRVSGRKLESLFETFRSLFNEEYKIYFGHITYIIKLLSASRETDVSISLSKDYCRQIRIENILINNFIDHLLRNSKLQRKKIFKNNKIESFLNQKDSFVKFIRYDIFEGKEPVSPESARYHINLTASKLYDKVFVYSDSVVNDSADKKMLHRMRLKAKPLRYLIEFVNEVYNCNLDYHQEIIKEFVEQAGLIHDIDMLIERVNKFSELINGLKHKDKALSNDKSLSVFVKYLNSKRIVEYNTFCGMIFKIETDEFKQKLINELAVANVNKTL